MEKFNRGQIMICIDDKFQFWWPLIKCILSKELIVLSDPIQA